MSICCHCGHRKGKRSCPALAGAICSRCCGQHRLVEIDCPSDCIHLGGLAIVRDSGRAVPFTKADYSAAWDKLRSFALAATEFSREVAAQVGDGTQWDPSIAIAYVHHGHRSADGNRLIDRFVAARGRALSPGEAAAIVALQRARASLFEIAAVRVGVGLDLRDVLSGETLPVREVTGSARLREHDVLFAWVMGLPEHRELTGAVFHVERSHVERVRARLDADLAIARTRWPGIADADLVGSIAWAVFDAVEAARDANDTSREAGEAPPSYTFDDDADDDGDAEVILDRRMAEPGAPVPRTGTKNATTCARFGTRRDAGHRLAQRLDTESIGHGTGAHSARRVTRAGQADHREATRKLRAGEDSRRHRHVVCVAGGDDSGNVRARPLASANSLSTSCTSATRAVEGRCCGSVSRPSRSAMASLISSTDAPMSSTRSMYESSISPRSSATSTRVAGGDCVMGGGHATPVPGMSLATDPVMQTINREQLSS